MKTHNEIIKELVNEWGAIEYEAREMIDDECTHYNSKKIALRVINEWLLDPPIRQIEFETIVKLPYLVANYRRCAIYISSLIANKLFDNINPYK